MSTKNIISSLIGVIVIGGAIYFFMENSSNKTQVKDPAPISTSKENVLPQEQKNIVLEPKKNASSDEIIDYIVDGQSNDEMTAVETALKTPPSEEKDPTIVTNF